MPPLILPLAVALASVGIPSGIALSLAIGTVWAVVGTMVGMAINSLVGMSDMDVGDFDAADTGQGLLISKASSSEPLKIVYGFRRVGGVRVFTEAEGGDNHKYLHMIIALAEGEIESIDNIYFNDTLSTDSQYSGVHEIYKHLGADGQAADSTLVSRITNWTTSHKLSGVAYIYTRLEFDQDAWSGGLPPITADIKGVKVYDPRDSATAWSDNPALCVRDYMTNTRYGRGIPANQIDDAAFIVAANYCDEMVTKGGSSQKRYTCNGVINVENKPMTVVNKMLSSCRGMLVFSGGKYKIIIDKPETASFVFDEDNIVGSWSIAMGDKTTTYNRIKAKIYNKDRSWQDDFITIDSPDLRTKDNELMLQRETQLPFTSDEATARQIATINLNQSRQQLFCEFTATIQGMRAEVGDVIYISHETPAWTNKKFRVMKISLQNNDEVLIAALEYDVTVYDFGTISTVDATPNTNLPNPFVVNQPTGLTVSEELYYTSSSAGVKARALLSWTNADAFAYEYEVEFKETSDSAWTFVTVTKATSARVDDLATNGYDFRVRTVNASLVRSSWTSVTSTLAGLTTPPADMSGFSVRALDGSAYLSWTAVDDLDVIHGGYIRVRHSNLTSGATWDSGVDIGKKLGGNVTDVVLPLLAGTYLIKAVDSTDNFSVNAVASITTVKNVNVFNVVTSLDEAAGGFAGVKEDMKVTGSNLRLADAPYWVFLEDGSQILMESGELLEREIGNTGAVDSYGTYDFSTHIDLGQVYTSRVYSEFETSSFKVGDLIDQRVTNMDTWQNFDGEPSDKVTAELQMRMTDDNPASSPTWTTWQKLLIGDFKARAFDFRVVAESADSLYNIDISKLKAVVDMPDRVERAHDITSGSTTKSITYVQAYYATPTVGITANSLDSGGHFVVSNSTRTGFDINFYSGSGTGSPSSANFNYQSIGY
jgi:hypothetical protein